MPKNMNLAISTTVFGAESPSMPLEKMLEIISKTQFKQIELSRHQFNLAKRVSIIEDLGLHVWSTHGTLGYQSTSHSRAEREKACDIEFARMEDVAVWKGRPYVVHYFSRFIDKEYHKNFYETIEKLYKKSSELGLILAVETAPYKPQENERYPDSLEIANFVRSFQKDDLQMTIDINHSNLHEDLKDVCQNCRNLIANIHVSDNHGVYEDHLPPGEGIINMAETMTYLIENGYKGPCNIEIHLPDTPTVESLSMVYKTTKLLLNK